MSDLNVTLRLRADDDGMVRVVRSSTDEVRRFGTSSEQSGRQAQQGMGRARRGVDSISRSLNRMQAIAGAAFVALGGWRAINRTFSAITSNTIRQENALAQLEARLQSTDGAAGRSVTQLTALSAQMQDLTTFSNEAVEEMQGVLLTFTNIAGDQFDDATRSILDISTALGTDLRSAAQQVGRALNDPIQGLDGLTRSGIQFSDSQRETIRALAETGDMAGAQQVILAELETQFGGAAEAARGTFGGALQALRNQFDDLLKFEGEMPDLTASIEAIIERLADPALAEAIEGALGMALAAIPPATNAAVVALETFVSAGSLVAENLDLIAEAATVLAAVITTRLVAALAAKTTAALATGGSLTRLNAALLAATIQTQALAAASRAGGAALALMGGPLGVAAAGATAIGLAARRSSQEWQQFAEDVGHDSAEAEAAISTLQQVAADGWQPERIGEVTSAIQTLRDEAAQAAEDLQRIEDRRRAMARHGTGFVETAPTADEEAGQRRLERIREEIRLSEHLAGLQHHDDIAQGLDLLSDAGDAAIDVMERLGLVTRNAAGGLGEMAAAREAITDPLNEQIAQLEREVGVLELLAEGNRTAAEAQLEYQYQLDLAAAREADAEDATLNNVAAVDAKYARLRELTGQVQDYQAASEAAAEAEQEHRQRMQQLTQSYGQLLAATNPVAARQQELNSQLEMMTELASLSSDRLQRMGIDGQLLAQIIAALRDEIAGVDADPFASLSEEVRSILDWVEDLDVDPLVGDIETLEDALESATDPAVIERLESAIARLRQELDGAGIDVARMMGAYADGTAQALRSVQQLAERGSTEYRAIQVAIEAANVAAAAAAILNQGMGDPYTAPARMAAMATAVAGLIGSALSFGGMGGGGSPDRQETQGTGTVLGDREAQTESIIRASEITARATSELVGINRGMLRALQALQAGIGGASGMLARGAGRTEFAGVDVPDTGPMPDIFADIGAFLDPIGLLDGVFSSIHSWFGGSSRVVDEGIEIVGGTIGEMIEQAMIGAFQEVEFRRWRWGSRREADEMQLLDDQVGAQFSLIFEALADSVLAAAMALGLPEDEITEAIESFVVDSIRISLMDMSAEEQQAEIEAVIGEIFDGLAGAIVPFIDQFQQVGEGLGETLIRVATGLQVTQEAARRLGFALDEADPERLAQFSEQLIDMVGGLDQFIEGLGEFFQAFAPDEVRLEVAEDELTRALEAVNLTLPETREGMWALMESLDATTEQGAEQIATLLRLAGVADEYYQILEQVGDAQEREAARQAEALADLTQGIDDEIARLTLSPLRAEVRSLMIEQRQAVEAAEALTDSEEVLARQRFMHQLQAEEIIGRLKASIQSLTEQLFGSPEPEPGGPGIGDAGVWDSTANQIRDALIRALEGVEQWLERSDLTDPSLTAVQQFEATQSRFDDLLAQAHSDDPEIAAAALAELPGLADDLVAMGTQMFGSATPEFQEFFAGIQDAMGGVLDIEIPEEEQPPTSGQVGAIQEIVETVADASLEQMQLAGQLLEELGALAELTGQTPFELAEMMGVPLQQAIEMMGIELSDHTTETVDQLTAVANMLGTDLVTLADEIGFHIGELQDQDSLLSQALQDTVAGLPEHIQDELNAPLAAIWDATTEADANDALADLLESVEGLDPDVANALAPFFEEIDLVDPLDQSVGLLADLKNFAQGDVVRLNLIGQELVRIADNLEAQNDDAGIPSYGGGGWVNADSVIRAGEAGRELVLPNPVSEFLAREGIPVRATGGGTDPRVVERLDQLIELERRSQTQRDELAERQVHVVDHLSESIIESARRAQSDAGVAA